jgi:hypothetical protein
MVIGIQAWSQDQSEAMAARARKFDKLIGVPNSGIINGVEYKMEFVSASTDPFLYPKEIEGTVRYDRDLYAIPLLYDIYKDQVIVSHLGPAGRVWFVQLDKKLVAEFVISGRLFRNFENGFHEVIFESDYFLIASRRSKTDALSNGISKYIATDQFFIVRNGAWNRFSQMSALSALLSSSDEKKQLKKFLKDNHISSRKLTTEDLTKVAAFIKKLRGTRQQ